MTSDRPCRRPHRPEEAMDELRRCAGSQFDPNVVAAFETVMAAMAELPGESVRFEGRSLATAR